MNHAPTYRVMVIEDERLMRASIVRKVNAMAPAFQVVAEASDGFSALKIIDSVHPHVIFTDIIMPQLNGLELIDSLYFSSYKLDVVIVSGYDNFEYIQAALRHGCYDYILKPIHDEEFRKVLLRLKVKLDAEQDSISQTNAISDPIRQKELAEYVKNYIAKNYCKDISMQNIATQLNYTVDYLGKLFRKNYGESPLKFLTRLRINKAKQLLLDYPDLKIKTIAEMVGLSNTYYFSNLFKSQVGVSPSDYRSGIYCSPTDNI